MKKHILLTNDDGIRSPGLWAAAEELCKLGFVTVAAPREQSSGMGRSLPSTSDGIIRRELMQVNGQEWTVYAVGGSPAQSVLHGILEIAPQKPDLVVSGINYGENVGYGVTISGTVGAAMEAASLGIPALAVSLQTETHHHLTHSMDINFKTAAHFAAYFAKRLLEGQFPTDVQLMKVDVPTHATPETEWQITRFRPSDIISPCLQRENRSDLPGLMLYREMMVWENEQDDTDVFVLKQKNMVSVTPLHLDMTARTNFKDFDEFLRK